GRWKRWTPCITRSQRWIRATWWMRFTGSEHPARRHSDRIPGSDAGRDGEQTGLGAVSRDAAVNRRLVRRPGREGAHQRVRHRGAGDRTMRFHVVLITVPGDPIVICQTDDLELAWLVLNWAAEDRVVQDERLGVWDCQVRNWLAPELVKEEV